MIALTLPFHRKARVWFGDLPQAYYDVDQVIEKTIAANRPPVNAIRRVAVELLIPTGGRAHYGLLGAELNPHQINKLNLKVFSSLNTGKKFVDSIALQPDDVRIGLPKEYISGVLDGVFTTIEQLGGVSSGELLFNCAAHALVGSDEITFKHLSACIINILSLNKEPLSEQELTNILNFQL